MAVGKLFGLPETFQLDIRQFSIYNNLRLTISSQNGSTLGGSWAIVVGDSVLKQTLPCVFVFLENFILMRLKSTTLGGSRALVGHLDTLFRSLHCLQLNGLVCWNFLTRFHTIFNTLI